MTWQSCKFITAIDGVKIKTPQFRQTKLSRRRKITEDILGEPIDDLSASGAVANSPLRQTIRPIRQRARGPFSPYPLVKNALLKRPISTPILNSVSCIEAELAELRRAWARYRATNSRDAVYGYLESVFALVTRWQRLNCAVKNSRAVLRFRPNPPQMKPEPFGIVIFCMSDPEIADAKTRSKWSRVLRYAARAKPPGQRLTDFVKSNGGLNEAARLFARTARSASE
jgi:hypothetical protein